MLSFFEWLTMHNNWVIGVVWLVLMFVFVGSHGTTLRKRIKYGAIGLAIGLIPGGLSTYTGYHDYKNHYTTCSKPAAVASMYIFDAAKERCLRPFVGFIPVDQKGNVEIPTQKQKPAEVKYQLVTNSQGENNV